ncbi:antibiotic biosynthesis monooxygenase [Dyadobacter beijingensis]|nr:antibiotic biosynthesis monooxygenase [Dyadobacter beijingensis]
MPIHVAITRKVLPGKEEEFKDALRRFLGDSFLHGGVHGAAMMTALPGNESREIGILRTFADQAERDAFYNSKLFKDWEAYASTLTEEPVYRELTGLEAWFRSPVPPPRWKMAVATLCGVYPTSLFLTYVIGPYIQGLHPAFRTLIVTGCMVGLLTWVVMPQVTKVLKPWLSGRLKNSK